MHNLTIILGVPIDNLNVDDTLDRLEGFIQNGRRTGRSYQVATVNTDFITNALDDAELLHLLQNVDLAMADGMPIVWGAKLLGAPIDERVAGVDVVFRLAERAAQKGFSIYLFGAAPEVAARAAEVLHMKHPGLKIAGIQSPMIRSVDETNPAILDEIRARQPDILLVALGNPKQEKWIAKYRQQLHVPLMIGVGGTLDFIARTKKRAPKWMQRSGLEWVYRLIQEPGRLWRRYRKDMIVFSQFFIKQWWQMRPKCKEMPGLPCNKFLLHGDTAVIPVDGRLTNDHLQSFSQIVEEALAITPRLHVDLSQACYLDVAAFGKLVLFNRKAHELGGELALTNVPQNLIETLIFLRLEKLFRIDPAPESNLSKYSQRELESI